MTKEERIKAAMKNLTKEEIEIYLIDIFYGRETSGTLPITAKVTYYDNVFFVTFTNKPRLITGLGGFLKVLEVTSIDHINLYVNGFLYIGDRKKQFVDTLNKIADEKVRTESKEGD